MVSVRVLTNHVGTAPLPALGLLHHDVSYQPLTQSAAITKPLPDLLIIDTTVDMVIAHRVCKQLDVNAFARPILLVVNDSGLAAISSEWGATDIVMSTAAPSEIEARIRLAIEIEDNTRFVPEPIRTACLTIDEARFIASVSGRPLNLTFKEFELLKFLVIHPSQVFSREQLLSEVWGYDYFGGTRTIDVHVRRLRAKLGDRAHFIETVRHVGYRFKPSKFHDNDAPVDNGVHADVRVITS